MKARADLNARIAARVRGLRSDLGMTLDALALRSAVSRSMISLVERGESNATAVVLEKIAAGLGVSLASLFDDATAPESPVSRRADRSRWRDPESGYLRRNISPTFPSPIQIVEVILPAGARVAYETGAREARIHQQIWVQRQGRVEVTVGRVVHRLAEDDCLAFQLDQPTAFKNPTRKPVRYLVVIAARR